MISPTRPSFRGAPMSRVLRHVTLLIAAAGALSAQQAAKPRLTNAEYAKWESLGNGTLSPDGKWVAYDFRRGNGSQELRYRGVDATSEQTVRSATNPQFTAKSRFLVYTIVPDTAGGGGRGGRGGGGRGGAAGNAGAPGANRNKVGVVDLRNGT